MSIHHPSPPAQKKQSHPALPDGSGPPPALRDGVFAFTIRESSVFFNPESHFCPRKTDILHHAYFFLLTFF